jgi:hypothetical protein
VEQRVDERHAALLEVGDLLPALLEVRVEALHLLGKLVQHKAQELVGVLLLLPAKHVVVPPRCA